MQKHRRITKVFVALLVFLLILPVTSLAANEQMKVSEGVQYDYNEQTISSFPQAFRQLTVDLNDPYTTVDVSYPTPLNRLMRTTAQANQYTGPGKQVVGAVNGSFYWSKDQGNLPMYLIAYRDRLINAGIIATGKDQYVNQPIAFGIDRNGKGKIDAYTLDLSFNYAGVDYPITSTDKHRSTDNLILYTPLYPAATTETNGLGWELVISGVTGGTDLNFGETVTGTVTKIRERGDQNASIIPKDGFVLSAHGDAMQMIKDIKIGETISITANIDDQWKGSSFMLTSGPELVKAGKVHLGIDATSDRARERAPRTAIAIDQTGSKVFMVTVDGRQEPYSKGMSLPEFANYLVSIGAYHALNLDGGGSTTMAVRKPGDYNVSLYNRPSDGTERPVSTALFALSTAPEGTPSSIAARVEKPGVYLKGTKGSVVVDYVMDQHYNPVNINRSNLKVTSPQSLITPNGLQFTASKSGAGSIAVQYGSTSVTLPFEVVDAIATIAPSTSAVTVRSGESKTISVKAFDAKKREVIFDPSFVKWSVTNSIGMISSNGVFTATKSNGTGAIQATLANQTVTIPVTIGGDSVQIDAMETITNWQSNAVNGTAQLSQNSAKEPSFEGKGAVKLAYDFTGQTGTSAAYLEAKTPISLGGNPVKIAARVYGDASQTWLRGKIADSTGKEYTINFTPENGLKWIGWNFVTADIPADAQGDLTLKQIYIAQPTASLKTKGLIMVDDVKALFSKDYTEGLFKDTGLTFRAEKEIKALVNKGIIAGYADGSFGPYQELTRLQGAILLARAKNLPLDDVQDPGFSDMTSNMNFYREVAAVAKAGYIRGKEGGTKFDPNGKLTRAEMAAILQRGFNLPYTDENYFNDIKGSFAYREINSLAANNITQGIGGGKFGPSQNISRADFSVFLFKALEK